MLKASPEAVACDRPTLAPLFSDRRQGHDDDRERSLTRRAVQRASDGDGDAMGELYDRYAGRVYSHVRRMMRDRHDAEDVTQLVFLKLTWNLDRYDERSGDFCAWLLRVARRDGHALTAFGRYVAGADSAFARLSRIAMRPRWYSACTEPSLRSIRSAISRGRSPMNCRRTMTSRWSADSSASASRSAERSEGSVHALYHRGRMAMRESLANAESAPATYRPKAVSA